MEITRDVVLDLLPLYLADEVSADTRALVEEYLDGDPALLRIAKERSAAGLPNNIPIPVGEESKVEAFKKTKSLMLVGAVVLTIIIATATGLALLAFFLIAP
jgi:hypothetical protein